MARKNAAKRAKFEFGKGREKKKAKKRAKLEENSHTRPDTSQVT